MYPELQASPDFGESNRNPVGCPENTPIPEPIIALLAAPVAWLPAPPEMDSANCGEEWAGTLDLWERPEGTFYTLSAWGAVVLGVHLVEMTGRQRKRALALGVPIGEDGPDCRWAALAEEGPKPRQIRERPCLVRPKLVDGLAGDYRIEADLDRKKVPRARTTVDELLDVLKIATRDAQGRRPAAGKLAGGLGRVRTPA